MPTGIYIRTEEFKIKLRKFRTGKKLSDKTKQKLREARLGNKNPMFGKKEDKHNSWKGDGVGYGGLHEWVRKKLGNPDKCEHCGKRGIYINRIKNNKIIKVWSVQYASKNGEYLRSLGTTNWLKLCSKCHKLYDMNILKIKMGRIK